MRTTLFDNPKRWETESDRILTTITGTTSWKETTQAIGSQITKESEIHYASCNVLGLQKEDTASLTSQHKKARRRLTSLSCVIQQGMLRPAPPAVT